MMMIKNATKALLTGIMVCVFALPAFAHFQMVYTSESALEKGGDIDLKLVFTHPFEAGHTMKMEQPEAFYVVHKEKRQICSKKLNRLPGQALLIVKKLLNGLTSLEVWEILYFVSSQLLISKHRRMPTSSK